MARSNNNKPETATTGQDNEELLKKIAELEAEKEALRETISNNEAEKEALIEANNSLEAEKEALKGETVAKGGAAKSKEKMVKVKLPRVKKDQPDAFVSVNNRTFLIQRGKYVDVPECVAEVLAHKEEMVEIAEAFEEKANNSTE